MARPGSAEGMTDGFSSTETSMFSNTPGGTNYMFNVLLFAIDEKLLWNCAKKIES